MDDPDVVRNETLIAMQMALQRLSPQKKEVAELYFFQGLTIRKIADYLGMSEGVVKEQVSDFMQHLGDELIRRTKDLDPFWRKVSVIRNL